MINPINKEFMKNGLFYSKFAINLILIKYTILHINFF